MLFFMLLPSSMCVLADISKCDFGIEKGEWRQGNESRQESEYFLTNELREKLSRFEECIEQEANTASTETNQATKQVASADGGQADSTSSSREEELGLEKEASQNTSRERGRDNGNTRQRVLPETVAKKSSMLDKARRVLKVKEDSIARLLREAMEKETDPAKKAALGIEYDKHVGRSAN